MLGTKEGGDLQTLWHVRCMLGTEEGGDLETLWHVRFVLETEAQRPEDDFCQ